MKLKYVKKQNQEVQEIPEQCKTASRLSTDEIEHIAEIFKTPIVGSYNWDYTQEDNRIHRLYQLGKKLNWNVNHDINWEGIISQSRSPFTREGNAFGCYEQYLDMSEEKRIEFDWVRFSDQCSQFLHGEQGALIVASQLVSCAPTYNGKLYAASQAFDEARHVEFFNQFIDRQIHKRFPCRPGLKAILDMILTDERWDLKLFGMQVIIEGLALAAFNTAKAASSIPVFKEGIHFVTRDEGRHVAFGVNYLEEFTKTLSPEEKDIRAFVALEAMRLLRDPVADQEVFNNFGWDVEHAMEFFRDNFSRFDFKIQLFGRIIPNLKRIGLLETEKVRQVYGDIGLLDFENITPDTDIDWQSLEKPLSYMEKDDSFVEVPDELREQMIAHSLRRRSEAHRAV
ncbi:MAG: ferritin-like domain-containing protein [SAR324 cluster bacterium]|nr:ferritin-like domain-containing protein [SAR324 cluster bacterium]